MLDDSDFDLALTNASCRRNSLRRNDSRSRAERCVLLAVFDTVQTGFSDRNQYRLATRILYPSQKNFILKCMTHAEYDEDKWKADCGCFESPPPKPGKTVKTVTEVTKTVKRKKRGT